MRVIVFIDGPFPTEADLALAAEHGTKVFRNGRQVAGFEPHDLAVAVDPAMIPEGFTTSLEAKEPSPEAPKLNPSARNRPAPAAPRFVVPEV